MYVCMYVCMYVWWVGLKARPEERDAISALHASFSTCNAPPLIWGQNHIKINHKQQDLWLGVHVTALIHSGCFSF